MAATIDMNFQSDLMAIFEENLFWRARGSEELLMDSPLHGQNELKKQQGKKTPSDHKKHWRGWTSDA